MKVLTENYSNISIRYYLTCISENIIVGLPTFEIVNLFPFLPVKYMVKGGKTGDKSLCVHCRLPIKSHQMKYIVNNNSSQLVGYIHSYCYPFKQSEYIKRGHQVATSVGTVVLKPKR